MVDGVGCGGRHPITATYRCTTPAVRIMRGNPILGGRVGSFDGAGGFCVAWLVWTVYGVALSRDLGVWPVAGLRGLTLDPCLARDVPWSG